MTSKDFCVWLRGYLEALGDVGAELEIERIKKELDGVVEDYVPLYPTYTALEEEVRTLQHCLDVRNEQILDFPSAL